MEQIVSRCLEKTPARRYQTPDDMAHALEQALPDAVRAVAQPPPAPPAPAAPSAVPPAAPTPPPQPVSATPASPSTTWMDAWAKSWQRANRRRFAWIGTFITLALALVLTLARFGVFDGIIDGFRPQEPPTGPTATFLVQPALPAEVVTTSPDGSAFNVQLPADTLTRPHTLTIRPLTQADVQGMQPAPQADMEVRRAFQVDLVTQDGEAVVSPAMARTVTITATYTDFDLARAGGDPDRLTLLWFNDGTRRWEALPTSVDSASRTLTAQVDHFSVFGVGIQVVLAATPTPTPAPTATPIPTPTPIPILITVIGSADFTLEPNVIGLKLGLPYQFQFINKGNRGYRFRVPQWDIALFAPVGGESNLSEVFVPDKLGKFDCFEEFFAARENMRCNVFVLAEGTTIPTPTATPIPTPTPTPTATPAPTIAAFSLRITTFPRNGGSVTAEPASGADGTYTEGQKVVLTARPARGFQFQGWSGAVRSSNNPVTVVMTENLSVTALFTTVIPTPTPTATPTPTPTPIAEKSATLTSLTGLTGPTITPLFGPVKGVMTHDDDGFIEEYSSEVVLADAVFEARFFNPHPSSEGGWSNGFSFRNSDTNVFHAVVLDSDSVWHHYVRTGTAEAETLSQQAFSGGIDISTGGYNVLRVIALGKQGRLFISGQFTANLDLSSLTSTGDVTALTGYFSGHELLGRATTFDGFSVWPLQSSFGLAKDAILHDPDDGSIASYSSGINLTDAVMEARFFNPYPVIEGAWSYGLLFRNPAFNIFHTVIVRSTGEWLHILSTGSVDTRQQLRREASLNIDTSQNSSNHLRLIALGDSGWLFINDVFIAELDLSGLRDSGEVVAIGSYFQEDEIFGKSVVFQDFTIWSLSEAVPLRILASTPTPTPTPTATPIPVPAVFQVAEASDFFSAAYGTGTGANGTTFFFKLKEGPIQDWVNLTTANLGDHIGDKDGTATAAEKTAFETAVGLAAGDADTDAGLDKINELAAGAGTDRDDGVISADDIIIVVAGRTVDVFSVDPGNGIVTFRIGDAVVANTSFTLTYFATT